MHKFLLASILLLSFIYGNSQQVKLKHGQKFRKSATVVKSVYTLDASGNKPAIVIQGNNIILDFNGAVLNGSNSVDSPDHYQGIALSIKKGKNITIRNLTIRGYKTALIADRVEGLKIENCNLSYNYRLPVEIPLALISKKENSFPAAMVLNGCRNVEIAGSVAKANQGVIVMKNCTGGLIYNNDFSFNSDAALSLFSSSGIQVLYNRFNFNVIDTSLAGSSSIFIDANSSGNIFYKNAVTHSVNGIIIRGNEKRDLKREEQNLVMENDLSYNIHSGIQSTYSGAVFNKNRIFESSTGILLRSPRKTVISNNQFRYNRTAIEVSGTGSSTIHHNLFYEDQTALRIFLPLAERPFSEERTVSALVVANSFNKNRVVYDLSRVDSLAEFNNLYQQYDTLFKADTSIMNLDVEENEDVLVALSEDLVPALRTVATPANPFKGSGRFAGKNHLVLTRWGPYDFSYPFITITELDSGSLEFRVLGPGGTWQLRESQGVEEVIVSGEVFPGTIKAKRIETGSPVRLILEYRGNDFTDSFGKTHSSGALFTFPPTE